MSEFISFLAPDLECFVRYRKAGEHWNDISYMPNLKRFDKYCKNYYPQAEQLTQEMVNSWCAQRESEQNNSCLSRIYAVVSFVRFLRDRGLSNVMDPPIPSFEKRLYIPHPFSREELVRFFEACDNYLPYHHKSRRALNNMYSLPVVFRLMYSTGMRTVECRQLLRRNVNLENGVISIENTKGYEQHYVVMHDSMLEIMKDFDCKMQALYPDREYFFCNDDGKCRSRDWIMYHFRILWDSVNTTHATAYELRHNYAVQNINNWINDGFCFNDKLVYLSKSMGHTSVSNTVKYYYSIVPGLADILLERTNAGFEQLIPEVHYEEQ